MLTLTLSTNRSSLSARHLLARRAACDIAPTKPHDDFESNSHTGKKTIAFSGPADVGFQPIRGVCDSTGLRVQRDKRKEGRGKRCATLNGRVAMGGPRPATPSNYTVRHLATDKLGVIVL